MWYIFKSDGTCISSCDFEPNHEDLQTRGEIAVEHDVLVEITSITIEDDRITNKPPYTPTTEELLANIRSKRNQLLTDCDWTQLPDAPLMAEKKQTYAIYRQALRDFPETCDPANPVWPVKPGDN